MRKPQVAQRKGKRKLPQDEDTVTVESASDDKATKSIKQKPEKNVKVPPAAVHVDDETDDVPKKKKMRKLNNPFAPAQPNSLDWVNQYNLVSIVDNTESSITADRTLRVMVA